MISAFAGILYFNKAATTQTAENMLKQLPLPSSMQVSSVALNGYSITVATVEGKMALVQNESCAFSASGTIFNKEEVCRMAQIDKILDDYNVLYKAFDKCGKDVFSEINGDWMIAAYNINEKKLVLARSWGISSLYYYKCDEYIAFATHLKAFDALHIKLEPDLEYVASVLCSKTVCVEKSGIRDVFQLKPATYMEISTGGTNQLTWWKPTDIKDIKGFDEKANIHKFLEVFDKAVTSRINTTNKIASTLSAGLDSSSVSALAARKLRDSGNQLYAITSVPQYADEAVATKGCINNEGDLTKIAADYLGNVNHTLMDCADIDPIEEIKNQLIITGRPQYSPSNAFWINNICKMSSDFNCGVLLIGQCGNATVSWSPEMPTLFPKNLCFDDISFKSYFKIIYRITKQKLNKYFNAHNKKFNVERNINSFAVNDKYAKKIACVNNKKTDSSRAKLAEIYMGIIDIWYHYSLQNGVEVRDPTMDKELMEFVFSLPVNAFYQDSINRRLIRIGMNGLLPDEILMNNSKGHQAADIVLRVRKFNQKAEEALNYIEGSRYAQEVLDIQKMRSVLERIKSGEVGREIDRECDFILLRGISAGLFLAKFN